MSIATQMQRFKDIGDAIREAINTRNNEVEVDDLKFDDFADIIMALNNINTDTYTVPTDIRESTVDLGEYNKIRKVELSDFYLYAYNAGHRNCWTATNLSCGLSTGSWSNNRITVTATAKATNSDVAYTTKTSTPSISVDATSVYNNGYSAGKAAGKYTKYWKSGSITVAKNGTATISPGFAPSLVVMIYSRPALSNTSKQGFGVRVTDYVTNHAFFCAISSGYAEGDKSYNAPKIPANASSSWNTGTFSGSYAYYLCCFCWGQS